MSLEDNVLQAIDAEELVDLTLTLSDLPDFAGYERPVAEGVLTWARSNGLPARLQDLSSSSANVIVDVAEPEGGGVPELMLNAHLDTEGGPPVGDAERAQRLRGAWRADDLLIGMGLINDRLQVAAQIIAAQALVRSGAPLPGGLMVVGVAQETGAPVTEHPPGQGAAREEPPHHGEGGGTRALLDAGIVSRRAIIGEPNGFTISGAECGFLRLRIDLEAQMPYTPFVRRTAGSGNPFEVAGHLVVRLTSWAVAYEHRRAMDFWGGRVVPKAQVSGIRSWGWSYTEPVDRCTVFLDVRTPPRQGPEDVEGDVRQELEAIVADACPPNCSATVTVIDSHPGFIAPQDDPTVVALRAAHELVHGQQVDVPIPPQISMWHDTNAYMAHGIPAVSYGVRVQPERYTIEGRRAARIEDAVALAQVYALAALRICGRSW